jgi:Ca2+-binding RTX toxin-like protein
LATTVDLQTKTVTPLGETFSSITKFVGDISTSTLIGPNSTSTWTITATNQGTVGTTSFSGFANLTGGTANDTFKLASGVGVTGTIDGRAGSNTLDYSAYTTSIVVDLLLPAATNIGAIKNIQNVNSGTGNSILVGNGGSDSFTVKGGHNLVIGGGGGYKLTGGTGQDILIAGTTSYDTNLAALTAILAYWGRTDLTYAQEVSGLSTVGVSYQDGTGTHTAVLNISTVFDNGVADTLAGGAGLDWFFAHQTGSNQDVLQGWRGGEVITGI